MNILDQYVKDMPSDQSSVDLFDGEWASKLPLNVQSGAAGLFEDFRIELINDRIGGFKGKAVLELGPLEGGHTHMMLNYGASNVLAIEANTRSFVKCLIAQNLLQMSGARFILGDFDKYLEKEHRFDFVLASGVLYHCLNPVKTIVNIAKSSDTIGIWSQYYDEEIVSSIYKDSFSKVPVLLNYENYEATAYTLSYGVGLNSSSFCGGINPKTSWMPRSAWINLFESLGYSFEILAESTTHPNGPEFTAVARKGC